MGLKQTNTVVVVVVVVVVVCLRDTECITDLCSTMFFFGRLVTLRLKPAIYMPQGKLDQIRDTLGTS